MEEGLREVLDGQVIGGHLCEDDLHSLMNFIPDALGITNMRLGGIDGKCKDKRNSLLYLLTPKCNLGVTNILN